MSRQNKIRKCRNEFLHLTLKSFKDSKSLFENCSVEINLNIHRNIDLALMNIYS